MPSFKFIVDFDAPNRKRIFRVSFDYEADTPIAEHARVVCASQVPGIKFPGPGDYAIRVRDEKGDTVDRRLLPVRIGSKPTYRAKLNARAELNSEYGEVIETVETTLL